MEIRGLAERLLLAIGGDRRGNQKKAAQQLGIGESVLNGWLKDNIHEKLGVDLNWLISGEGQMYVPAAKGVAERSASYEAPAQSRDRDVEKVLALWKRIPKSKRSDVLKILEALAEKEAGGSRKLEP